MSEYNELLMLLKLQNEEKKTERFLEAKGYINPSNEDFGLNQWTCQLVKKRINSQNQEIDQPIHLVSFISIPADWQDESIDTNSENLRNWFSEYKWHNIPGVDIPFSQKRIQACNEGVVLFQSLESSIEDGLDEFLLIRRDGVFEYGLGKKGYYLFEKDIIFQFIQIIGRFWQFLAFIKDLQEMYFQSKNAETKIVVNLRGTEKALLGNLASGWNEPISGSYESYRPKCIEKNLQIKRNNLLCSSDDNIQEIVRWFATRIDNAWGQFEPRCYVSRKHDETTPFAFRKQN